MKRICQRCKKTWPESHYPPKRATCRKCRTLAHYAIIAKHPRKYRKYMKAYRLKRKVDLEAYGLQYRAKARMDAFVHYSGNPPRCQCCGEVELAFLTIDHVNGGGTKQRKRIGRGGTSMAIYLRKRRFPVGYQILCYNCNCAKAYVEICPHKLAVVQRTVDSGRGEDSP